MCSHHILRIGPIQSLGARARGGAELTEQITDARGCQSTDIDRAVNGDARRASLSMLLVSISLRRDTGGI